ncbi:LxmA leader domain family RiPP [Streptomyces sp. NPDC052114]|uniref:LxmA leader domain family RiPP n=1 Tax=unclassified Streptomyces TaxID=2593676 RepID=UPI0034147E04
MKIENPAESLVSGYRTYTDGNEVAQVAGTEGPETTASITTATPVITTTTLIFDC